MYDMNILYMVSSFTNVFGMQLESLLSSVMTHRLLNLT